MDWLAPSPRSVPERTMLIGRRRVLLKGLKKIKKYKGANIELSHKVSFEKSEERQLVLPGVQHELT